MKQTKIILVIPLCLLALFSLSIAGIVTPVSAAPPSTLPWPIMRHDLNNTGAINSSAPTDNGTLWKTDLDALLGATVNVGAHCAVDAGLVIATTQIGYVVCLHEINGSVKWVADPWGKSGSGAWMSGAAIDADKGLVIIGDLWQNISALNLTDGSTVWSLNPSPDTSFWFSGPPQVDPDFSGGTGLVLIGQFFPGGPTPPRKLWAINETDGTVVWNFSAPPGMGIPGTPAVHDGRVFIGTLGVGGMGGTFYCLNETNGTPIWSRSSNSGFSGQPAVADGKVFIGTVTATTGNRGGYALALDEAAGTVIWNVSIAYWADTKMGIMWGPAVDVEEGAVYFEAEAPGGTSGGTLAKLNMTDGSTIWNFTFSSFPEGQGDDGNTPYIPASAPTITTRAGEKRIYIDGVDNPYVGSGHEKVFCFDADTGALVWSYLQPGGNIVGVKGPGVAYTLSSPTIADNRVFVGSYNGIVTCFGYITVGPPSSGADYNSIQAAINDAWPGATIQVWPGNYTENVIVNKSVNLFGAGVDKTVVNAFDPNQHIFNITANNVNLTGFKIIDATGASGVCLTEANYTNLAVNLFENNLNGISIYGSINNTVSANNMTTNISSYGIVLSSSSNNSFSGNNINSSSHGVYLSSSNHNNFSSNNIKSGGGYGVYLSSSSYNNLSCNNINSSQSYGLVLSSSSNHNIFSGNNITTGIYCDGVVLESSSNYNIFTSNNINSSSYSVDPPNNDTNGHSMGDGIDLYSSSHNIFLGNNVTSNSDTGGEGVYLGSSLNNTFSGNNITAISSFGVYVSSSSNYNNFIGNTITSSQSYGVYLYSGSSNNNFTGNTITSSGSDCVYFSSSSNYNNFIGNTIMSNNNFGIVLSSSSNNSFSGNNITGGYSGVRLLSSSNNSFSGNNIHGLSNYGVGLANTCRNNTFSGNNISGCGADGIRLTSSQYNVISWNSIKDNGGFGIYLASSVSNRIFGNNVTSNSLCGIQVDAVSNLNTIYNNYFSNSVNAKDDGQNYWNVSMTAGVNIIGGPYLAGNYWSWNYTGADTNNDTIGDTLLPYNCGGNIVNGGDWLPLTPPTFQPIGDLNISGILCPIVAVSNSTISGFSFNNTAFWFNVSGMEGASGYCAIIVPTGLNLSDYVVYINGTSWPYTLSSNGTHYYIHITYTHSKSEITVQSLGGFVPEFPFLGTTILLAAAVIIFWTYKGCRRRLHYQRIPAN